MSNFFAGRFRVFGIRITGIAFLAPWFSMFIGRLGFPFTLRVERGIFWNIFNMFCQRQDLSRLFSARKTFVAFACASISMGHHFGINRGGRKWRASGQSALLLQPASKRRVTWLAKKIAWGNPQKLHSEIAAEKTKTWWGEKIDILCNPTAQPTGTYVQYKQAIRRENALNIINWR